MKTLLVLIITLITTTSYANGFLLGLAVGSSSSSAKRISGGGDTFIEVMDSGEKYLMSVSSILTIHKKTKDGKEMTAICTHSRCGFIDMPYEKFKKEMLESKETVSVATKSVSSTAVATPDVPKNAFYSRCLEVSKTVADVKQCQSLKQ